jgi:hypothetical protein
MGDKMTKEKDDKPVHKIPDAFHLPSEVLRNALPYKLTRYDCGAGRSQWTYECRLDKYKYWIEITKLVNERE